MSLRSQRRIAAEILKVGENRVWIDPRRLDEVELAITREEIRRFIHEKFIKALPEKGVSRARARLLHEKKKSGRRRGSGSRSGSRKARVPRKRMWMGKVRALRKKLLELKNSRAISEKVYRRLYVMAGSGVFKAVADVDRYIEAHNLRKKR